VHFTPSVYDCRIDIFNSNLEHTKLTKHYVQKLPAYELLNKENKQCKSITHKTHAQKFSLGSQNRHYQLDFSLFSFQCYNTYLYMPKNPIPWTENHRIQYHGPKTIASKKSCAKIMHKTIRGSAHPNIGSKTKIFRDVALDPIMWGYGCPSNPLLTMWKEYNTTQQSPTCFLSTGGHRRA